MEAAPFLPRVTAGRLVLSRARWRVLKADLQPLAAAAGAARWRLARRFREERRMPRLVLLVDADNELLVDFDNPLSLDAVVELVKGREEIVLTELFPPPEELCAEGPEGRFVHEMVVPFIRRPAATAADARGAEGAPTAGHTVARRFPPGSAWIYAKLYAGTATVDQLLRGEIAPLAREACATGAADRWFFLRYGDPEWHLRVRFHGDPRLLREHPAAARRSGFDRATGGGLLEVQLDTYDREVERYGGEAGIGLAEEVFRADSEAVVAMLESCSGDAGAELRWRLLVAGIDRLLADFGLELDARLRLTEASRDNYSRQYHYDALREHLAGRYRRDRAALQRVLDDGTGIPALARRSDAIAGIASELLSLERRAGCSSRWRRSSPASRTCSSTA